LKDIDLVAGREIARHQIDDAPRAADALFGLRRRRNAQNRQRGDQKRRVRLTEQARLGLVRMACPSVLQECWMVDTHDEHAPVSQNLGPSVTKP